METFAAQAETGHEMVVFAQDEAAGYRCIIAIHRTRGGLAQGGTRLWHYASEREQLTDALRLARGMTYKHVMAGLAFGGGKAVIQSDADGRNRERLFLAHGRTLEKLAGRFITAEDVGTSMHDMRVISRMTGHVAGVDEEPAPWTARGVFRSIQAAARFRWGADELAGRRVALQGCGQVGYHLAAELCRAGARLVVSDTDPARLARTVSDFAAESVAPHEIYDADAEILAPCALGGVINDETIPRLKVEIIAGGANNQLLEDRHGDELHRRNILYAPDYVANAGGLINISHVRCGWTRAEATARLEAIRDTMAEVFELAQKEGIAVSRAADRLAETRLARDSDQ